MADTNMRIVIDGDSSGAVTAVKQVSGAMDGLAVGAKGATSGLNTSGVSADNVGRTFTKSGKVFKSTGKLLKSSGLDAASAGASFLSTVPALSGMSSAAGGLVLGLESLSQVVGSLGPVGFGVLAGAAVAGPGCRAGEVMGPHAPVPSKGPGRGIVDGRRDGFVGVHDHAHDARRAPAALRVGRGDLAIGDHRQARARRGGGGRCEGA